MTRVFILAVVFALAGCAPGQPQKPAAPNASDPGEVAVAWAPSLPPGFDPAKPGLQKGCYADGNCWAIFVEVPR